MPRTISDEEYNHLLERTRVADFVEPIYNNPKTSRKAKELIKEAYPGLEIPGFDLEQQVEQKFADLEQRETEKERKAREAEEDRKWHEAREKAKRDFGLTDETIRDVEQLMRDRNIGDYEVAASYFASKNPKTSAPTYDSQFWHHDKQPNYEEISKDPEGWARREILGAIQRDQENARGGR